MKASRKEITEQVRIAVSVAGDDVRGTIVVGKFTFSWERIGQQVNVYAFGRLRTTVWV